MFAPAALLEVRPQQKHPSAAPDENHNTYLRCGLDDVRRCRCVRR